MPTRGFFLSGESHLYLYLRPTTLYSGHMVFQFLKCTAFFSLIIYTYCLGAWKTVLLLFVWLVASYFRSLVMIFLETFPFSCLNNFFLLVFLITLCYLFLLSLTTVNTFIFNSRVYKYLSLWIEISMKPYMLLVNLLLYDRSEINSQYIFLK